MIIIMSMYISFKPCDWELIHEQLPVRFYTDKFLLIEQVPSLTWLIS
jgi:hypothetical protein